MELLVVGGLHRHATLTAEAVQTPMCIRNQRPTLIILLANALFSRPGSMRAPRPAPPCTAHPQVDDVRVALAVLPHDSARHLRGVAGTACGRVKGRIDTRARQAKCLSGVLAGPCTSSS
jgi:hypothetical protein